MLLLAPERFWPLVLVLLAQPLLAQELVLALVPVLLPLVRLPF
ncbi:MAG TPA: hypothetical protein VGC21_06435 [Telluria sp.]